MASENFVDVFSLLTRWQLDPVDISCRQFRHVISTKMDTVCLREFDFIRFATDGPRRSTFRADWWFTANGEKRDMSTISDQMEETLNDMAKRISSSAVTSLAFNAMDFTDDMLVVS